MNEFGMFSSRADEFSQEWKVKFGCRFGFLLHGIKCHRRDVPVVSSVDARSHHRKHLQTSDSNLSYRYVYV